jgi:hypothetical protein
MDDQSHDGRNGATGLNFWARYFCFSACPARRQAGDEAVDVSLVDWLPAGPEAGPRGPAWRAALALPRGPEILLIDTQALR